jgi:hypothetical protein
MNSEETRSAGGHHFHYDRSERLAAKAGGERVEVSGGLFKRNRSLAIILLDLGVIVIIFLLLQFVITPGRSATRSGDFRLELKAFRFEDEIYSTLEITRFRDRMGLISGEEALVEVRIEDGEEILDVLPGAVDETIVISRVLGVPEEDESPVRASVSLLGDTVDLLTTPRE